MCKEYKVTGLGKPVEFLVIVMYAKGSIRLMNFKQNPYLNRKKDRMGKRSLTKIYIEKYRQLNFMYVFSLCASLNKIFILSIYRLIQFPKRKEPSKKVFVVDLQVREKEKQVR